MGQKGFLGKLFYVPQATFTSPLHHKIFLDKLYQGKWYYMNFFTIRNQLLYRKVQQHSTEYTTAYHYFYFTLSSLKWMLWAVGLHNGSYRRAPYSKVCAAGHCQEQPTSLKELQTVRSMSTKGFEQLHKLHCFLPDKATASLHLIHLLASHDDACTQNSMECILTCMFG